MYNIKEDTVDIYELSGEGNFVELDLNQVSSVSRPSFDGEHYIVFVYTFEGNDHGAFFDTESEADKFYSSLIKDNGGNNV